MTPKFCGSCGAPIQLGSAFCVQCGSPVPGSAPTEATVPAAAPPAAAIPAAPPWPSSTPPFTPQAQAPPPAAPGYWPPTPYEAPPKRKSRALVIAIVVIVLVVVIASAAVYVLLTPAKAHFVSITKTGLNAYGNMTFDVTIVTETASIGADKLHVNIRSLQSGIEYDSIYYYNTGTLSVGSHTWGVDVAVDANNLSAFTYEFSLELNGSVVDQSTVT